MDRCGIQKYFQYDPRDPVDAEIVRRIRECTQQYRNTTDRNCEHVCRRILSRRLHLGWDLNSTKCQKFGDRLEKTIEGRSLKYGISQNELVRQLFCVQFGIKRGDGDDSTNGL